MVLTCLSSLLRSPLTEKAEWPPMKSAAYEAEPEPDEPFDYNAKPGTFYIEAEGTGSMPVKDVVRLVSRRTAICCCRLRPLS